MDAVGTGQERAGAGVAVIEANISKVMEMKNISLLARTYYSTITLIIQKAL